MDSFVISAEKQKMFDDIWERAVAECEKMDSQKMRVSTYKTPKIQEKNGVRFVVHKKGENK